METDSTLGVDSLSGGEQSAKWSPSSVGAHDRNGDHRQRDSGVFIPSSFPSPFSRSLNPPLPSPHDIPLTEMRRPSMVEMLTNLEANLENLSARDIELMYALHTTRRGSFPSEEATVADSRMQGSSSDISAMQQLSPSGTDPNLTTCCRQWNPRFHSQILERYWKEKAVEFLRRRYRVAVLFIALFSVLWVVFFSVSLQFDGDQNTSDTLAINSVGYSIEFVVGGLAVFIVSLALLVLTFWRHYGKIATALSITLALVLMIVSILIALPLDVLDGSSTRNDTLLTTQETSTISFVTQFIISSIVILVVYTLSRLPIWFAGLICIMYMIVLELTAGLPRLLMTSSSTQKQQQISMKLFTHSVIARILFHICLNIVGFTTGYLSQVRLHDTFWRIAQCVLARKMIESERDVEEKTIHSMMPKSFAEELLSAEVQIAFMLNQEVCMGKEAIPPALRSVSAPFTVRRMNEVSILFADIVGFTQFSSSLSACELVSILDEIFSNFDILTQKHRCEKINTLGDCYFCVSGCPTEDDNHANNCVEMGLAIITSLAEFRNKTNHPVEMRVGVHTGSVLCGVMGTKRFKFDVWSRDVTIANQIESVGTPGNVIISSTTLPYLSPGLFTAEEITLSQPPTELRNLQLFKVAKEQDIPKSMPSWRQKIRSIDSQIKGETSIASLRPCAGQSSNLKLNNTLRDSLSRQSYIQRCASYTELADPTIGHQVIIDKRIVELMEEQQVNIDSYYDPQLNAITLSFDHRDLEQRFRNYGRSREGSANLQTELGYQLAKRSYLIDTLSLFFIFIIVMVAALINFTGGDAFTKGQLWIPWLLILIAGLVVEGTIVILAVAVYCPELFPRQFVKIAQYTMNWNVRTIISLVLIYSPMAIVIVTLTQCHGSVHRSLQEDFFYVQMVFYITIVVLICSVSFMEVSYIVKLVASVLSAIMTLVLVTTVHLIVCTIAISSNTTFVVPTPPSSNRSFSAPDTPNTLLNNYYNRHIAPEAAILFLLILLLLFIVNRMSELSVRLSFIGRMEAALRKQFARQQKYQVEWLLYNIIPPRVALELRNIGRYSRVHDCAGVIFASIVNFSDFSTSLQSDNDEQAFRLLNKIVRDFDNLLDQPKYASVEKIKTIGSTYMAASGLNLPADQPRSVEHLVALIHFALELGDVLRRVSIIVPGFSFLLRVGFNYGPVTSGVVGSNKLLFDIWGDTVNVASRMDSTGYVFKIHMPERCLDLLKPFVVFDAMSRVVEIKGKGSMKTVFVTGKKKATVSCLVANHNSQ